MKTAAGIAALLAALAAAGFAAAPRVLRGEGHNGDWTVDAPSLIHRITVADLPQPYATRSADHGPRKIPHPAGARLRVPPGFTVSEFASGLEHCRLIRTAPNGDLFVAESYTGRIRVLRPAGGKAGERSVFAGGLRLPFGIAFWPPGPDPKFVYVANTDSVLRFPYRSGDLHSRGPGERIAALPGGGQLRGGGHWTRDIAVSPDGKRMFVSVGSVGNDMERSASAERHRADILQFRPDGSRLSIYASGIRNAVGIAVQPQTGTLWASVNERDGLGDDLVPDYITRVRQGEFFGWPWFYMGRHTDPRHRADHPRTAMTVSTPDVLLQSHSASLEMCFYDGQGFPQDYHGDVFAAEHGSWNRRVWTGFKVIRVPLKNGNPTGEYQDFLTGFVTRLGVWGRPVGVAVGKDGALYVSEDEGGTIWRIAYGR